MKIIKRTSIILIIAILASLVVTPNLSKAGMLNDAMTGSNLFMNDANNKELFNATNEQDGINTIYYALLGIAIIAAFIVGSILGIKFMTSGVSGQAKVKERLIPFALGLVVVFGGLAIWRIVYNILNGVF